jgi:hypothetical protein
MRIRLYARAVLAALVFSIGAGPARAQQHESVGIRAQGMAGAFVAVADDATATWWNPAGLASGAYLDSLLEYSVVRQPEALRTADGAIRAGIETRARGVAFAFPAMGLSYYRLQISEIQPFTSTAEQEDGREDQGVVGVGLRSVVLNQFGMTVGQSVGSHFVVASTVKLVRASVARGIAAAADVSFEDVNDLEGDGAFHTDLDVGAMAMVGIVRAGLSVKNVRAPEFGPDADREEMPRRARAGVALTGRPGAGIDQLTVAFDADLTTAPGPLGETKNIAGGVETWLAGRRVGLRAGVSTNRIGERLLRPSAGVSLAFRPSTYLEAQYTAGPDKASKGWGFDLRVTF